MVTISASHAGLDRARNLEGARPAQRLDVAIGLPPIAELDAADVGFRRHVRVAHIGGKEQCGWIERPPPILPFLKDLLADFNPINEFGECSPSPPAPVCVPVKSKANASLCQASAVTTPS